MTQKRQWTGLAAMLFAILAAGCSGTPNRAPVCPPCPETTSDGPAPVQEPLPMPPVDDGAVTTPVRPAPAPVPPPPPGVTPPRPPVVAGPPAKEPPGAAGKLVPAAWRDLPGWPEDNAAAAYPGLMASCRVLPKRDAGWTRACNAARDLSAQGVPGAPAMRSFMEANFAPWRVVNSDGSSEGLITGYYEPLLKGSRRNRPPNTQALYGPPDDLVSIDLGDQYPELKPLRLRGRMDGRRLVPYWSRAELAQREQAMQHKVLAWVQDPIELFFLQVQGSGRIELEDGSTLRVGYADTNGHPYRSIGRWLMDRGELTADQATMQGIQAWARANPRRVQELLNANPSYVFFRELPAGDGGPPGALGVPLVAERSIAVDPRAIPLGAPVFLATTHPETGAPIRRLTLAQDTGTAIKGGVRADYFFGSGANAGALAGRMRGRGNLWALLPVGMTPK